MRDETVEIVMKHFFAEHQLKRQKKKSEINIDTQNLPTEIQCEEALMEAFSE